MIAWQKLVAAVEWVEYCFDNTVITVTVNIKEINNANLS